MLNLKCRLWFWQPLLLLLCFVLSQATSEDSIWVKSICSDSPKASHEHFLCQKQRDSTSTLVLTKDQVLDDQELRISDEFVVPENMKERVGFWFDVYTKYSFEYKVIHHEDFPWIIYKVVDTTEVMKRPKARWLNNVKAEEVTKAELNNVRLKLKKISRLLQKNSFEVTRSKLLEDEVVYLELINSIPGSIKKNAAKAAQSVRYQTGQKNYFIEGIKISQKYMRTMESIFLEKGIPIELTRLPMVESSFNRAAISKAGATGLWQFMPATAKKFMLLTENIDERRSIFKSTAAAAVLLKENYMLFKDWSFALTAYNHGPGGIRKAMNRMRSNDLGHIIDRYEAKFFRFATQNYYSEFLAALYAQKYAREVFGELDLPEALEFEKVELKLRLKAGVIAQWSQTDIKTLIDMNPDLTKAIRKNREIPKGFQIYLTPDMAFNFTFEQRKAVEDFRLSRLRKIAQR